MVEILYHLTQTFIPGLFSLVYRLGEYRWFQTMVAFLLSFSTETYLRQRFKEEQMTDVVTFHFAIIPAIVAAANRVNKKIRITAVVTDPYTASPSWFYHPSINYFVFSEDIKKLAMEKGHVPEENIQIIPFLLNNKFRMNHSENKIIEFKKKHNLPLDKKIVLLAGGGEGLPNIRLIINNFILSHPDFAVVVVCGRDLTTYTYLKLLAKSQKKLDLHVFGFVDFMDELVYCCDCAVIKAGTATLMEFVAVKKPFIICHFIYGQELGNVDFAIKNGVGSFVRKPAKITKAVSKMLTNENYLKQVQHNYENLPISTESEIIADLLVNA